MLFPTCSQALQYYLCGWDVNCCSSIRGDRSEEHGEPGISTGSWGNVHSWDNFSSPPSTSLAELIPGPKEPNSKESGWKLILLSFASYTDTTGGTWWPVNVSLLLLYGKGYVPPGVTDTAELLEPESVAGGDWYDSLSSWTCCCSLWCTCPLPDPETFCSPWPPSLAFWLGNHSPCLLCWTRLPPR